MDAAKGKTPTLLLSEIIADACAEPANDGYDQIAEAVYAQIQAAGMVLVPIEPTGKMVNAGQYAVEACDPSTHIQDELRASWKAMIEEAP